MENGLVTKGARLMIPSTLRSKVLEQIHEGHLGIEKCMLKVRDSVFWPGISNDIRETVEKCGICQASSKAAKPIGDVSDVPPHTWHTLGTDLFYWNKIDYLVIRDSLLQVPDHEKTTQQLHTHGDQGTRTSLY